jgi:hypothetical protein
MAIDRKTPTVANFGASIAGNTYADQVNEEIAALWDRVPCYLGSIGGTANAITATASPTLDAYRKGQSYYFTPTATNTLAATINIDGLGVRNIKRNTGAALTGGELVSGMNTHLVDDGTQLLIQSGAAQSTASLQASMFLAVYQLANNTAGGTPTVGARTVYPLNTVLINEVGGASLGSNQITLPAGTYEVTAVAQFSDVDSGAIYLRNTTLGSDITTVARSSGFGDNGISGGNIGLNPSLKGKFTIAGTSVLELQYFVQASAPTTGLGNIVNSGAVEQYGYIELRKVA